MDGDAVDRDTIERALVGVNRPVGSAARGALVTLRGRLRSDGHGSSWPLQDVTQGATGLPPCLTPPAAGLNNGACALQRS
jgi:hypothetical protein